MASLEFPGRPAAIVRARPGACLAAVGMSLGAIATMSASLVVVGAATQRDYIFGLVPVFRPGEPATVVAWASAAIMAAAGASAAFVAIVRRAARLPVGGWPVVAVAFGVSSVTRLAAPLAPSWGIAAAMAAAAFAIRAVPRRQRGAMWLGLAIIAAAPLIVDAGAAGGGLSSLVARAIEWSGALGVTMAALSAARITGGRSVTLSRLPAHEVPGSTVIAISARAWPFWGLTTIVVLVTASAVLAVMHHGQHLQVRAFHLLSYVDLEGNVPSWYSSMLLLAASFAAGLLSLGERGSGGPHWRAWRLLAVGFAAMSCDEAAGLHEHLTAPLRLLLDDAPALRYPLVLPGVAISVATWLYLSRFLRDLAPASRRRLLSSGAVFLAGALGFETMGGWYDPTLHGESATYLALTHAEETCEMLGVTGALYGMLRHFETAVGTMRIDFE